MNQIALQSTIHDLLEEYNTKAEGIEQAIKDFEAAETAMGMACTVQGTYVEPVVKKNYLYADSLRKNLLKSGWKAFYNRLNIGALATAKDKALFDRTMADPPPLTFDNAKATFGDYFVRPRFHILRGLAEVFTSLDPAYKSHSKVKIGVNGLPKRVILSGWGSFFSNHAKDKFTDLVNALATYQGLPQYHHQERLYVDDCHQKNEDAKLDGKVVVKENGVERLMPDRGITIRKFQNGNAHVFFEKWTLLDINRALAEFYGEVLPDVQPDNPEKAPSTEVAKDLQFYWTPRAVVELALDFADIVHKDHFRFGSFPPEITILEPSSGEGHILEVLRDWGYQSTLGIEYDPRRAAATRAKGFAVQTANFLEQHPTPVFDRVIMNPPFYGKHYVKHVQHALKFLKPGGKLVSILPATARYDHKILDGEWRDLPTASFADSGTNVPTVMLKLHAPRAA